MCKKIIGIVGKNEILQNCDVILNCFKQRNLISARLFFLI